MKRSTEQLAAHDDGPGWEFPEWVPKIVVMETNYIMGELAAERGMYESEEYQRIVGALSRLATDIRMKEVWSGLSSRKRLKRPTIPKHRHPVSPTSWPIPDKYSAFSAEELAVGEVFLKAHSLIARRRLLSVRETQVVIKQLQSAASALQKQSAILRKIGLPHEEDDDASFRELERLSKVCKEEAQNYIETIAQKLNPKRVRGDGEVSAFVRGLAATTTRRFGSPLYSTIATIANVTLGQSSLTETRVREIVRAGVKAMFNER